MQVEIIDDFLPSDYFQYVLEEIESSYFPWFFNDFISYEDKKEEFILDNCSFALAPEELGHQLTHSFILQGQVKSDYSSLVQGILERLGASKVIRAKVNSTAKCGRRLRTGFHKDWEGEDGVKVGILYLNSCDGGTIMEDGTFIESKRNRMVIFDAGLEHSGVSHSTNLKRRLVMNINFV